MRSGWAPHHNEIQRTWDDFDACVELFPLYEALEDQERSGAYAKLLIARLLGLIDESRRVLKAEAELYKFCAAGAGAQASLKRMLKIINDGVREASG